MQCSGQMMIAVFVLTFTLVYGECPAKCLCTKYKTFCSLASLKALPSQLPNTTELLKIGNDEIIYINKSTIAQSGLFNLIYLEFYNDLVEHIEPGAFQNMSRLEYLLITYNRMYTLKTNSFIFLENLYLLNLTHNLIQYLEPGTFAGLDKMRVLDLGDNWIKHVEINIFEGLKFNANCNVLAIPDQLSGFVLQIFHINPIIFKYLCAFSYFNLGESYQRYIPPHVSSGACVALHFIRPGFIYKNVYQKSSGLLYADLTRGDLKAPLSFQPDKINLITYLDLSYNRIETLNSNNFLGFTSVKTLKINYNCISQLSKSTFHGLHSLRTLEITFCRITTIESYAFGGLTELQILDLSWNHIQSLQNFTFSGLQKLKELKLQNNIFQRIDIRAFSDLKYLKILSNTITRSYSAAGLKNNIYKEQYLICFLENFSNTLDRRKDLVLPNVEKDAFLSLQRLDSLEIVARVELAQDIQVIRKLHLYIDVRRRNTQEELHSLFFMVRYVKDLNFTLIGVNSTEVLTSLSKFPVTRIRSIYSNLKFLKQESLIGLTMLKSLTILNNKNLSIHTEAFHDMKSLIELKLFYGLNLTYVQGSFSGLTNLKYLSILKHKFQSRHDDSKSNKEHLLTKCLEKGVFLGLDNLERLDLSQNELTCLSLGAFHGLDKLQELYLSNNSISAINAGVFGGMCVDDFEMTCKNVTLPQYCNSSNALVALRYLNLTGNNITHIHPHAFVSCTNLHTLDLSGNKFLTLDNTFLYTPGLSKFHMMECGINNIPSSTFNCTPLLSEINFRSNERLYKLPPSITSLRHLQSLVTVYSPVFCNCELYEIWVWMRQHNVNYKIGFNLSLGNYSQCGEDIIEIQMNSLTCNIPNPELGIGYNLTSKANDFAFFIQYIEPVVLIIILVFGIVSNGFLLFISFRHSDMRTRQNICVIHLAIVDIISLVLNLPISYWDIVNVRWELEEIWCKVFLMFKDIMVSVNVLSVVALSVERFLVARNFKNLKKACQTNKHPITWLLFMTWVSAVVTSIPSYFSAVVDIRCLYCPPGNQEYIKRVWTFQLVMYCMLPAAVITFLNIRTSMFLRESVRNIPGEIVDTARVNHRKTAANVVLILVIVFLLSYLPNYILRALVAWSVFELNNVFLISFFTFCLFFSNTMFNPISLFIMSSKFKSYALSYFSFLENDQNSQPALVSNNRNIKRHK